MSKLSDISPTNIQELLRKAILAVTFKKSDGSERVMKCTLRSDLIPEAHKPAGKKVIKENEYTVRVYDLDKNAWRSFRFDSVSLVDELEREY